MKKLISLIFVMSSGIVWASEMMIANPEASVAPSPSPFSTPGQPTDSPVVPNPLSPAIKIADIQGTLVSVDTVFQRLTMSEDGGQVREFSVDPATRLTQNFAQINFQDLHPGDRVRVLNKAGFSQVIEVDKL